MFSNPTPQNLMELMERICGSWKYSKEFKRYERKLVSLNREKSELNGRLRLIAKDKKKAKKLMESVARSGQLIEAELSLGTEVFLSRMLALKKEKRRIDKQIRQMNAEIEEKETQIDGLTGVLLKNKGDIIQQGNHLQISNQNSETSCVPFNIESHF